MVLLPADEPIQFAVICTATIIIIIICLFTSVREYRFRFTAVFALCRLSYTYISTRTYRGRIYVVIQYAPTPP